MKRLFARDLSLAILVTLLSLAACTAGSGNTKGESQPRLPLPSEEEVTSPSPESSPAEDDHFQCDGDLVSLAGGAEHWCALWSSGCVSCWGDNTEGQLGAGDLSVWSRPVWVPGIHDAVTLTAGKDTTCVKREDSTVVCWGGLVKSEDNPMANPTLVSIPNGEQLAVLGNCDDKLASLQADGTLWTVGRTLEATRQEGEYSALFQGTGCRQSHDGNVECCAYGCRGWQVLPWLEGASVAEGGCGIVNNEVRCAKSGPFEDQLTCQSTAEHIVIDAAQGAVATSGGELFLMPDGQLLELDRKGNVSSVLSNVKQAIAVYFGWCALVEDNALVCSSTMEGGWYAGGKSNDITRPRAIEAFEGVASICGEYALKSDGELLALSGTNRLTDPESKVTAEVLAPEPIEAGSGEDAQSKFRAIDSSEMGFIKDAYFSCALDIAGEVWCWGENKDGQLGDGRELDDSNPRSTTPSKVVDLIDVEQVEVGDDFACARTSKGEVYCWGSNRGGRVQPTPDPDGTINPTARPVRTAPKELNNVVDVSVGNRHACALRDDGAVYCWGGGDVARGWPFPHDCSRVLHDAGPTEEWPDHCFAPEMWQGLPPDTSGDPVVNVIAGDAASCVVHKSGHLECWGKFPERAAGEAAPIEGLENADVIDVCETNRSWCALARNGEVYCWGWGPNGQLGDGLRKSRALAVRVEGLPPIHALGCGGSALCAIGESQSFCWGKGRYSEFGWAHSVWRPKGTVAIAMPTPVVPWPLADTQ